VGETPTPFYLEDTIMTTFAELSKPEAQALISRVNEVFGVEFQLSRDSINAFWNTMSLGIEMTETA